MISIKEFYFKIMYTIKLYFKEFIVKSYIN